MALNFDAIGKTIGPITKTYGWKDAVLYALSIGAGFSELDYCYEKQLKVLPTFSMSAIIDFFWKAGALSNVNPAGVLHGEQDLIFHRPFPSGGVLTTEGRITNFFDKGKEKGALVRVESDTVHDEAGLLFTSVITLFARLDGGFGGENAPATGADIPGREPDFVVEDRPSENQPLLYRLTGDVFQLHVDPEFARMSGFEKPIMHGLCTHGFAGRALIKSLCPGEPEKVRRLFCRFSRPLYPGTPIKTLIWKTSGGKAVWRTVNAETNEPVIDRGIFEFGDTVTESIRFDGRVAVITGAGAGLGRIYALELARRGAKVIVNDYGGARDGSGKGGSGPADEVVSEIVSMGGEAVAHYGNVALEKDGKDLIDKAVNTFGKIDILVNNAGILRDRSFMKMTSEDWHAVLDVHLHGAYHVTRYAFRVMKDNGYGRILMATSAAGLYGNFGQTNYAAAKMGLVGFMNALVQEGRKHDIRVNCIAPIAASRLTRDIMPPNLLESFKPEFVAPLVLVLCSEACPVSGNIYNAGMNYFNRAAWVTGKTLRFSDSEAVTPEAIAEKMDIIRSIDDGRLYNELFEQVAEMI